MSIESTISSSVPSPLTAGNHNYKWTYSKDQSQTGGSDCAWIDFVRPQKAQQFINTHFSGVEVLSATVDDDYEVYLANGTKVEFTMQGEWKEVKCPGAAVPAAIIPAAISKYVKANFPNSTIVKIDKKYSGYEVELNTDLELVFDKNGNFIGIDD